MQTIKFINQFCSSVRLLTLVMVLIPSNVAANNKESDDIYQNSNYYALLRDIEQLAHQGEAEAQFRLGWAYDVGEGLAQDKDQAILWYKKAAVQNHQNARINLAILQASSKKASKKQALTLLQLQELAEQNDRQGQYELGRAYYEGELVNQDYAEALRWFLASAEKNLSEAQYMLGYMYEHGFGIPQNFIQSYAWYNIAAASGHQQATISRDQITNKISLSKIEDAQAVSSDIFSKIKKLTLKSAD